MQSSKTGDKILITRSKGRRWEWRVVEGFEALGSWLDTRGCSEASLMAQTCEGKYSCAVQRSPYSVITKFRSRDVFMLSTPRVWLQQCIVQENGLTLNVPGTSHLGVAEIE